MKESNGSITSAEVKNIGRIIRSLTPYQAWTTISIIVMALGGSFGVGYKLRSIIAQAEVAAIQVNVSTLTANLNDVREKSETMLTVSNELEVKNKFLTYYTRILHSKKSLAKSPQNRDLLAARNDAINNLVLLINEQLSQSFSEDKDTKNHMPVIRVGIGKTPQESVVILNDGTIWPLPEEVTMAKQLGPFLHQ